MRIYYLIYIALALLFCKTAQAAQLAPAADSIGDGDRPNVIMILADDLGYGDLGCYGSTRTRTPNLDRMASEGLRMTDFYAFPSCSPSRAALMTGCYPSRVGFPDVVGPPGVAWTADKQHGLNPEETTIAEVMKSAGYRTGMVGKWHLGHFAETMPLRHGFDTFFGLPYSNDMLPEKGYPDLRLYDGETVLETNPDQTYLTRRYTDRAVEFIQGADDTPFFLYLAHSMPHVPLYAGAESIDNNDGDLYAAVIDEVDQSVGRILEALRQRGVDENTLVIFSSDNGPWLTYGDHAGSAGPFREGKGTTFEGGMRVPMVARWPNKIAPGGLSAEPASLADILPTVARYAGITPDTKKLDGRPVNLAPSPISAPATEPLIYWKSGEAQAVRVGAWKLHVPHEYRTVKNIAFGGEGGQYEFVTTKLALYNLITDPGERYDRSAEFPDKVADLKALITKMQREVDAEIRSPWKPM